MIVTKPLWRQALAGTLLFFILAASVSPVLSISEQPPGVVVIRLSFRDRAHLDAVAGELDIWEVDHDAGVAVVAVTLAQMEWLEGLDYHLEVDSGATRLMAIDVPLDPRYHYFDEAFANQNGLYLVGVLQNIAATYPELTELLDIGDAWEAGAGGHHRDIWALRITNEDPAYGDPVAKPVFFLLAGIHAREVSTPELAIRYIRYLTGGYNGEGGYGVDADVTWLVDHHVTYIVVSLNPDGHRINEGNVGSWWRKNVDKDDGCDEPGSWGVDLNRNHSFFWNRGGSSSEPCSETYRGPAAEPGLEREPEPEIQAFQDFFASVMLDQNGPNGDDELPQPAPDDASGLFITLHSYGDLVLFPWAHTYSAAPNASGLQTIGRKFAYHNGYLPEQGSGLYQASGTTDDWTYGKFGVASFTFEVGRGYSTSTTNCKGFFPAYDCIDSPGPDGTGDFWLENKPTFIYAHKIARTPYLTARGPDTVDLAASQAQVLQGAVVELTATIDDTRYSHSNDSGANQTVTAAEYYIDVPPWQATGAPVARPLEAQDGAFDSPVEGAVAIVKTDNLSLGRHTIFVRGLDEGGNWGAFSAIFVSVMSGEGPDAMSLEVSPPAIPIEQGVATAVATLILPGGEPAPGWIVTFTTDLGAVSPPVTFTGADGRAVITLLAGDAAGTAQVSAQAAGPLADAVDVDFYVPAGPTAGFSSSSPVCLGEAVVFSNTSSGPQLAPVSFFWEFGDGATSLRASPEHTYQDAGLYTVELEASNAGGFHTVSGTVEVLPLPQAGLTLSPLVPKPGEIVQLIDKSGGHPFEWDWDFGDGGQSGLQNPSYTFATTGTYTISLQVRNECGWSDAVWHTVDVGGDGPRFRVYLPIHYWDASY